jgi:hypothetical protein
MVELIEESQGLLPGFMCRGVVAAGVIGITESVEDISFAVMVAEGSVQSEGLLVVGDGVIVVAEMMVGVTEDV